MKMKVIGIIPARLASTRLPNKVLLKIAGKSMLRHVWEQANAISGIDELLIACDDEKIMAEVTSFGGHAMLTRKDHPNGTSRLAEAVEKIDAEVVVNIQGDQPLLDVKAIAELAEVLKRDPALQMATLAIRSRDASEYANPNVVKVVCNENGQALYFSRSPLPCARDAKETPEFWKHIGVYAYRRDFLKKFAAWPAGKLEETEKLEQLRVLERGYAIRVVETEQDFISVDTAEDLKNAEIILNGRK